MNIEGQDIETYQTCVLLICNEKITEEFEFHPRARVLKYQVRGHLDDKEPPKDPVSSIYNIEKAKEYFVAPSAEIE